MKDYKKKKKNIQDALFTMTYIAPIKTLENLGSEAGFNGQQNSNTAMAAFIGVLVKTFLSILGVIFIILILYAGYKWMMAKGEEKDVTTAKDTIRRAIIGLIITVGAYSIWSLIASRLIGIM